MISRTSPLVPALSAASPSSSTCAGSETSASPAAPHHTLLSLTVTGGAHFPSLHLDFSDRLNCIIGGRGAGKSGVLHYIRFGLDSPIPEEYSAEHDEYVRETLGSGTVVVATRNQYGACYTSSRAHGSAPVVRDESGAIVNVSLDGDLFKIDAYGQNEIEGIAKSPKAQLDLIDKFAEADIRRIDEAVVQIEAKLKHTAAALRNLADEIAEDSALEGELPSIAEALKGVDLAAADGGAPGAERTRAHDAKVQRGRERAAMGALGGELTAFRSALDGFVHETLRKLSRAIEGDLERGAHPELFRRAHAAMQRMAGAVEGAAGHLRTELAGVELTVATEGRALATVHATEEEAYRTIALRHDADRERAAQSERLHRRFEELSAVAKRAGDRRREEGAKRHEWDTLLAERNRLLNEKSAHRVRVAEYLTRTLDPAVRVTVTPEGDWSSYAKLLGAVLKGANIRPPTLIDLIAQRLQPNALVAIAEKDEIEQLVEVDPVKSGKEDRATKILSLLRASGRLLEIAMARFEDTPLIELKVGKRYRASRKLSTGQRCACILPILLVQSAAPLLVDQVEDNLDNAFIYEVLVKRIMNAKGERQLIVVTHNPNPPSLAGAERIFVLGVGEDEEGEREHGKLVAAGTFEEVLAHVETTEGGREAFLRRGERYGHIVRRAGES